MNKIIHIIHQYITSNLKIFFVEIFFVDLFSRFLLFLKFTIFKIYIIERQNIEKLS